MSLARLSALWICRARSMDFDYTDEQKQFAESVRRFAQAHLAADALKRAHDPRFPYDVAQLMAKQGLMGIALPERDGGQGGTLMDEVLAIEQVAAVCLRSADVVQFGNFGPIRVFAEYGSEAQKERWLGELLAGRMVMSLGMTEPNAGSAVTDLKTSARPDGSHYIINRKNWLGDLLVPICTGRPMSPHSRLAPDCRATFKVGGERAWLGDRGSWSPACITPAIQGA